RADAAVRRSGPLALPPCAWGRADGRVELVSTPSEAAVSVDGEYRGRTPLTLSVRPGRAHRITLTKPGYEPVTRELTVEADSGRRIQIELAAQYGDVEIVSDPPQAEIWADGTRTATTPATLKLTALPH